MIILFLYLQINYIMIEYSNLNMIKLIIIKKYKIIKTNCLIYNFSNCNNYKNIFNRIFQNELGFFL